MEVLGAIWGFEGRDDAVFVFAAGGGSAAGCWRHDGGCVICEGAVEKSCGEGEFGVCGCFVGVSVANGVEWRIWESKQRQGWSSFTNDDLVIYGILQHM